MLITNDDIMKLSNQKFKARVKFNMTRLLLLLQKKTLREKSFIVKIFPPKQINNNEKN